MLPHSHLTWLNLCPWPSACTRASTSACTTTAHIHTLGYPLAHTYHAHVRMYQQPKLQVSFAESRLFYRALLQKRPKILRSLPTEATPYNKAGTSKVCLSLQNKPVSPQKSRVSPQKSRISLHKRPTRGHRTDTAKATYEWVMSHVWMLHMWMSHVTRMNVTHMNESCHKYECHTYECHTYEWVTSHVWMPHI